MSEPIIAIIFDFDDTLGPDTVSFLLREYNIKPKDFWDEINEQVKNGWDPPQAYMNRILQYIQQGRMEGLTKEKLQNLGQKLPLFPGLPDVFDNLKKFVSWRVALRKAMISLEFYIISGGLEEIIRGTALAKHMNGIFGCNFAYNPSTSLPVAIKSTISFTEKTRFVFAINKGIPEEVERTDPYRVNDRIPNEKRRILFKNMIYIGDGPSDIPCLSLITKNGGVGIGASPPTRTFEKGYELARGERTTIGPYTANYNEGTDMRKALEETILAKGLEIAVERRMHVITAPNHSSENRNASYSLSK